MPLLKSKCRKHPHPTEQDARLEAIRLKKKWRLRQWPTIIFCDLHKAWHVQGPSVTSRKNQYHSDRRWEMLLSNPDLLTDQARRAIGADLSAPATHEEVEKLMQIHRNNRQRRRRGKQKKSMRGLTLVPLRSRDSR